MTEGPAPIVVIPRQCRRHSLTKVGARKSLWIQLFFPVVPPKFHLRCQSVPAAQSSLRVNGQSQFLLDCKKEKPTTGILGYQDSFSLNLERNINLGRRRNNSNILPRSYFYCQRLGVTNSFHPGNHFCACS